MPDDCGPDTAICVQNLSFSYEAGSPDVLHDVSFSLARGSLTCIAGSNGAGKSTLAKLLAGILSPVSGSIEIVPENGGSSKTSRGARAAYLAQHVPLANCRHLSVQDLVAMSCVRPGFFFFSSKDARRVKDAMRLCDIESLARKSVTEISGGQLQRAFLARMAATDADVLVLDEPTNQLDVIARDAFRDLLLRLKGAKTIVLVSHDLALISSLADKVLCISDAKKDIDHAAFLEHIELHCSHIPVLHVHDHRNCVLPNQDQAQDQAQAQTQTKMQTEHSA